MKIICGVFISIILYYLSKKLLLGFDFKNIFNMPIDESMKHFELIVLYIIIGGFIFQEMIDKCMSLINEEKSYENKGSKWFDLLYLLVAVFGSWILYICILNISRLVDQMQK